MINGINATQCACGSFQGGVLEYAIVDGTGGCCTGFPVGTSHPDKRYALFLTYTNNEGLWELDEINYIDPADAQSRCCNTNA